MSDPGVPASVHRGLAAIVVLLCLTCGAVAVAHAELVLSVYGGKAITTDSDLELAQPGGDRLTFHDVSWTDRSFAAPPYYGLRVAFYLPRAPSWGLAVDYTHAKMIAQINEVVEVTGTRAGASVHGAERMSDTIQGFELSHGHNLITVNLMYRWFPKGARDPSWLGRIQPYAGAGVGMALPHVEAKVNNQEPRTFAYQVTGPAAEGLVGLNVDLTRLLSVFGEYKLTYAHVTAELNDGGSIVVQPVTHHVAFGVSLRF